MAMTDFIGTGILIFLGLLLIVLWRKPQYVTVRIVASQIGVDETMKVPVGKSVLINLDTEDGEEYDGADWWKYN